MNFERKHFTDELTRLYLLIFPSRSQSLEFESILPENPKEYDNLQPPKEKGECCISSIAEISFFQTITQINTRSKDIL